VGRLGPLTAVVLRGIATVSQAPEGTPGPLWGDAIEDIPGHLTAGTRGPGALLGWRGRERQCQANRDAAAVPGPPWERKTPHAQHAVQAPPRALGWAGCAGAMTVPGEPLERRPGVFLGGIVKADPHDCARRPTWDGQADDGTPELPAAGGERASEEDREARKVLDRGGPSEPHLGRDGVAIGRQGPATGEGGKRLPRRRSQEAVQQGHDHGAK
jgi:hypothetical protein